MSTIFFWLMFRLLGERKFNRPYNIYTIALLSPWMRVSSLILSFLFLFYSALWLWFLWHHYLVFISYCWVPCECLADLEEQKKGKYILIRDGEEDSELGLFYKPLPCLGCGIGWFSWVNNTSLTLFSSYYCAFWIYCLAEADSFYLFMLGFFLDLSSHLRGMLLRFCIWQTITVEIHGKDLVLLPLLSLWVIGSNAFSSNFFKMTNHNPAVKEDLVFTNFYFA